VSELEKKSAFNPDLIFWGVVVVCLLGLFALVAIPVRTGPHTSRANACINNLRQIDAAAQQFALDKAKKPSDAINYPTDLTPYIKLDKNGKMPSCPQGGIYSIKKVGDKPTCSLGTNVVPAHVLP
jgi:type II secretory pathway pseudopilin PulG